MYSSRLVCNKFLETITKIQNDSSRVPLSNNTLCLVDLRLLALPDTLRDCLFLCIMDIYKG